MPDPIDSLLNARLPDGGPLYVETDLSRHPVVEPYNTTTALLFALIAIVWLFSIKPKEPNRVLKLVSASILLLGGIGGTLFHGTRSHVIFLILDVAPIIVLILGYCVHLFLELRLGRFAIIMILTIVGLRFLFHQVGISEQAEITIGYASSGVAVLIPIVIKLYRINWQLSSWVLAALGSFIIALISRLADSRLPGTPWIETFTMGTHFLWHTFGAIATVLLIIFWHKSDALTKAGTP